MKHEPGYRSIDTRSESSNGRTTHNSVIPSANPSSGIFDREHGVRDPEHRVVPARAMTRRAERSKFGFDDSERLIWRELVKTLRLGR
jgi:hypothetical protein